MPVRKIESYDQFRSIVASGETAVIDFWATWCGPCKMISPVLDRLSDEPGEGVTFYSVDVDEQPEIAAEVGIRAMPTFGVFRDGHQVDQFVGASPPALTNLVKKYRL